VTGTTTPDAPVTEPRDRLVAVFADAGVEAQAQGVLPDALRELYRRMGEDGCTVILEAAQCLDAYADWDGD